MILSMILEKRFSSAHFYRNPFWSDDKNQNEFGLCFSKYGHGHNYNLKVEVPYASADELEKTKFQALQGLSEIIQHLDHKHLNFEVSFFQKNIPTTENIAIFISEKITLENIPWLSLQLFETDQIWVELKNV